MFARVGVGDAHPMLRGVELDELALVIREPIEFVTLLGHDLQPRVVQECIQHLVFGYRELLQSNQIGDQVDGLGDDVELGAVL